MSETVNPLDFKFAETRWFEDFEIGERFYIPSRTMTDALFSAFQLASGDNHPIHYDRHWCQAHGHKDLVAHGYQIAIQTCAGAGVLPQVMGDAMIAFLEQSSRFLAPVYAGDTVYPGLEISDLQAKNTTGVITCRSTVHNQDGVLVMEGHHKYLLRKRPG
ncbi:MAG: MaoC family dehydratase [Pseudomonadota bacterium]